MFQHRLWVIISAFVMILMVVTACSQAPSGVPIKVGLIAPLSGSLSASGEAIQRGMLLAIDEVNQAGGVLGRPLELVVRDVQNDADLGVAALAELAEQEKIVGVFGSIFSPVMLAQLDTIHELKIPLINPWGSVSAITDNGRKPNYAFRVSVSDAQADEFLVRYANEVIGASKLGILADTSAWGDSNVAGLTRWLSELKIEPVGIERFDQGDTDMNLQIGRLQAAGADALLMIANAPEGAAIVRGMGVLGWKAPVISHWGISGGRFLELAGAENVQDVYTLQTFSFYGPLSPKATALVNAYYQKFGAKGLDEIQAPVGVVHGYDGLHLLVQAMLRAKSTDGASVQAALESLPPYDGLLKRYDPPFTAENHDALLASDYIMTVWQDGHLVPAPQPKLPTSK